MADRVNCVRWNGQRRCRAGVDTEALRDPDLRLPCHVIDGVTGALPCPYFEAPPAQAAELGPLSLSLDRTLAGLCPVCGEPTSGERDVDGHVVAIPCRHQLRTAR